MATWLSFPSGIGPAMCCAPYAVSPKASCRAWFRCPPLWSWSSGRAGDDV